MRVSLAALAAVVLLVLLPAQPAWAHSRLLKTDPADGTTVATPLAAVTLTFNELVQQQFSTIVVTGADGISYSDGPPRSIDKTLAQAVRPLPGGAVRVAWRTVSADGHPIEGQFTFTNTAAAAPAITAPTAVTTSTAGSVPTEDGGGSGVVWAMAGGVLVVVLAGGAFRWRRRRRAGVGVG